MASTPESNKDGDGSDGRETRTQREAEKDIRLDRQDIAWTDGELTEIVNHLPLRISQSGSANDLKVSINVAMLPPVNDFRGYEAAAPGTADYIKRAADEQRAHRFAIETTLVNGSERRRDRGQLFSAMLAATGLAGAIVLGLYGNAYVAGFWR